MLDPHHGFNTTMTKVFVGGLAWQTTSETLRTYFARFGQAQKKNCPIYVHFCLIYVHFARFGQAQKKRLISPLFCPCIEDLYMVPLYGTKCFYMVPLYGTKCFNMVPLYGTKYLYMVPLYGTKCLYMVPLYGSFIWYLYMVSPLVYGISKGDTIQGRYHTKVSPREIPFFIWYLVA
jgi:RNA recognition motif-containing protein